MIMKKTIIVLLLYFLSSLLFTEELVFKHIKGEKYRIITKVDEKVYIDGKFHHNAEILNKAAVECLDVKDSSGLVLGKFLVSEKAESKDHVYRLDEEFEVKYWRNSLGKYEDNLHMLYPLVRDIPLFPGKKLVPGDTWTAEGKEVHDFRRFDIQMPIHIPVSISYTYRKNDTIDNIKVAVLKMTYQIYKALPELREIPGWHPLLIFGKVEQVLYWDIENGRPYSYEENFDIIYGFNDHQTYEYIGTASGKTFESLEMNKQKMKEEIQKAIEKEKLKDTSVSADDEGVTITIEDITFMPESDILQPSEQEKIKKIAAILKKYPDRDLLIAGHTALAGTEEGRKQLSEKRAKAVGDYLFLLGIKNNMLFKGYGAQFPLGDNNTESGMKKNRRVEIKIMEN